MNEPISCSRCGAAVEDVSDEEARSLRSIFNRAPLRDHPPHEARDASRVASHQFCLRAEVARLRADDDGDQLVA